MAAVDLCTVADVKTELEISSDTSRDTVIQAVITGVSRAIHEMCQREFVCEVSQAQNVVRKFRLDGGSYLLDLNPYDLHDYTTLGVTIHADEPEEYELQDGEFTWEPYGTRWTYELIRFSSDLTSLHNSTFTRNFGFTKVNVSSRHWGFASVPEDVKRAAIVATCANLDRRLDAYALAANDLVDMDAGVQPARQPAFSIPMAALVLLNPYRRQVGAF